MGYSEHATDLLGNSEQPGEAPVGARVWKAVALISETLQAPSPWGFWGNEEIRATAWKQLVLQTEQTDKQISVVRQYDHTPRHDPFFPWL